MPIYEYRCEACQHEFETLQKMSEDPLIECPSCKAPKLKKLISAAAFRLKGGGWYETDFKNKGGQNSGSGAESSGGSGVGSDKASSQAASPVNKSKGGADKGAEKTSK